MPCLGRPLAFAFVWLAMACGGRSALDEGPFELDASSPKDASVGDVKDAAPVDAGPDVHECPPGFERCDDACCRRHVATGRAHTCFVGVDGRARCWGANDRFQLGDGTSLDRHRPVLVKGLPKVISVAAGTAHSCALGVDGVVYCWGANDWGQLGDDRDDQKKTPTPVSALPGYATDLAASSQATCAVVDGQVWCWGFLTSSVVWRAPFRVAGAGPDVTRVVVGSEHACALTAHGGVKCWGRSYKLGSQRGSDSAEALDVARMSSGVTTLASGGAHSCAVHADGRLACWGGNYRWELGNGTSLGIAFEPVEIPDVRRPVIDVATGSGHTCALSNGEAQCWGDATKQQYPLLVGSTGRNPIDIPGFPSKMSTLSAGHAHTCALLDDGSLACWGYNHRGQLGDGTTISRSDPVIVDGL